MRVIAIMTKKVNVEIRMEKEDDVSLISSGGMHIQT